MADKSNFRKDLIFPKAGHFMFIPYAPNGMPDYSRAYSSQHGVVVSISRDNALNTVDLPDGNSPYPAATYVQTQSGTMTYVLSTYDPELEALVAGAAYKNGNATDTEMWTMLAITLEKENTYIFQDEATAPNNAENIVIKDVYGNRLTMAETAEALTEGQFHYDSTTYTMTFSTEYKEQSLFIVYSYNGQNITSVEYLENPKITAFMAIVIGETQDKDKASTQMMNVVVDRCGVSGSVTPPTSSNDPTQGWTLTTNILKPRAGHSPIKVKFMNASSETV